MDGGLGAKKSLGLRVGVFGRPIWSKSLWFMDDFVRRAAIPRWNGPME